MHEWDHRAFGDGHIVQLTGDGGALTGIGGCGQFRMQGVILCLTEARDILTLPL